MIVNSNWLISAIFLWKCLADSWRTQSEHVKKNDLFKGCRWFQLYFFDFQLFYFITRIFHERYTLDIRITLHIYFLSHRLVVGVIASFFLADHCLFLFFILSIFDLRFLIIPLVSTNVSFFDMVDLFHILRKPLINFFCWIVWRDSNLRTNTKPCRVLGTFNFLMQITISINHHYIGISLFHISSVLTETPLRI